MTRESLRGMPAFLRFLGTFPNPDAVAHAMVSGPLAEFGASDVVLMDTQASGNLAPLGWNRSIRSLGGRIPPIPVTSHLPIARAVREGELIQVAGDQLAEEYPAFSFIEAHIGPERLPPSAVVLAAPMTCQGHSVGGFAAWVERRLAADDLPLVSALSAALGLWVTHPHSSLPGANGFRSKLEESLLSERQIAVLGYVAQGKTNRAIAAQLGYSESTVKLELSRVLDQLRVRDRQEAVAVASSLGLLDGPEAPVAGPSL